MKTVMMVSAIITLLVVLSTMICGLWIRANNITDTSSFDFHRTIGIVSVVCCVITTGLIIIFLRRL